MGIGCCDGRYADVMVHRLLAASLQLAELPDSSRDREAVRALADNLNTRHRNAQMAGRASVELHTLIYFKDRAVLADARITKVSTVPAVPIVSNHQRVRFFGMQVVRFIPLWRVAAVRLKQITEHRSREDTSRIGHMQLHCQGMLVHESCFLYALQSHCGAKPYITGCICRSVQMG